MARTDPSAGGCPGSPSPGAFDTTVDLDVLFAQAPVGLAVYDSALRALRVNAALERLCRIEADQVVGKPIGEFFPARDIARLTELLRTVLETGRPVATTVPLAVTGGDPDRVCSLSTFPLCDSSGRPMGVATAISAMGGRPRPARREGLTLLETATTRIGSTLEVVRTAEELCEVAVPRLADFVAVDLLEGIDRGEEPLPGPVERATLLRRAAILSRTAHAPEATHPVGELMTFHPSTPYAQCLASGQPLLIPVLDQDASWLAQDPTRAAKILGAGIHSLMTVPLRARETTLGLAHFYRWQLPQPFEPDDLALVHDLVARAAVCIDNARRYTREHHDALTLQHSLLVRGAVPTRSSLETAHRCLPARTRAGVGGDWFDILPLSGARVGLIVGDVTGRGIQSVACAGRLRTAMRTLAALDFTPDEALAHIDARVRQAADDDLFADQEATSLGSTCLYAIYDPVTGRCSAASAGHVPPIVVRPGGAAGLLPLSVGPPLGLGGLPFETTETRLPDGSLLALYTNGLLHGLQHDPDGLMHLLHALTEPGRPLDDLCQAAVEAALDEGPPTDDAILLLARTRSLEADRVATWDLPAEPEVVARTRARASRQLTVWGLAEEAPSAELVISELVTNAIRYGRSPIQLRLIREHTLICEVSDASHTSPHLRQATSDDEGGRGLFMVAQFADAWGTRYTPTGKTIWAELTITPSAAGL